MKNIHIIPTDKPSRLYSIDGKHKLANSTMAMDWYISSVGYKPHNIYITSDEEITSSKDWFIDIKDKRNHLHQVGYGLDSYEWTEQYDPQYYKKIILTTDPTLIADGVQAIDDDFLEWLIKNPTCENVPIITTIVSNESTYKTNIRFESWRKEGPKQEVLPEFTLSKSIFDKISNLSSSELSPEFQQLINDNWDYLIGADDKIKDPRCRCIRPSDGTCEYCESKESKRILDEAKEQKGKDYSEEEVRELIIKALTHNDDKLCGSLVTVEKEIRTANFNVWFDENKKK
jgi:hypothetical protein